MDSFTDLNEQELLIIDGGNPVVVVVASFVIGVIVGYATVAKAAQNGSK